ARMERTKAHDQSELESRANSLSTCSCDQVAVWVIDLDGCGPRIGVSCRIHGCFPRNDRPARKDVLRIEREEFEAKREVIASGMAPNTFSRRLQGPAVSPRSTPPPCLPPRILL